MKKIGSSTPGLFAQHQGDRVTNSQTRCFSWLPGHIFLIMITALFACFNSYSQKQSSVEKKVTVGKQNQIRADLPTVLTARVKGLVTDSFGTGVAFATISCSRSGKAVAADKDGFFEIEVDPVQELITVTATGYEKNGLELAKNNLEGNYIIVVLKPNLVEMEPVVISILCAYVKKRCYNGCGGCNSQAKGVTVNEKKPEVVLGAGSAVPDFSVYPNPATNYSRLIIKAGAQEQGDYLVSILDAKASLVQRSSISFHEKNEAFQLPIGQFSPGIYFILLENKKTGKQYSKKLIVQQ